MRQKNKYYIKVTKPTYHPITLWCLFCCDFRTCAEYKVLIINDIKCFVMAWSISLQPYRQGCHFYAKICLKKRVKKR